jgi:hypothetical protein
MKKYATVLSGLLLLMQAQVQAQSNFDIFSYNAPETFTLRESKGYLCYEKNEGKNYCQLFLYPATLGQNDIEKDFAKNWNFFARNPDQQVGDPETKEPDSLNGWQMIMGAARGSFNKQMFAVTVSTFTKENITYFVASVFTDKKYIPIAQKFIASVVPDENKFVHKENEMAAQETTTGSIQPTGNMGITKSTTNFDDGYTSSITNDFVQVTKDEIEVRLYYVDAQIDRQRPSNTNTFESYYWDVIIKSGFNTAQPFVREKEQYSYGKEDIWEATVTNKQTGIAGYLGMRLVFNNGGCRPIVVIAPDKNTYYSLFSTDEDFMKMLKYNKFAVVQQDLVGKWKSFEASSMGYYSIYTGDYAGMATASTNDEFVFNSNGSYQSTHAGTSTFNGSVAHGKSSYKGMFNVNIWSLTASDREENDPGEFSCQFEAQKGGCMLRLVNKKFGGQEMTLFKTN